MRTWITVLCLFLILFTGHAWAESYGTIVTVDSTTYSNVEYEISRSEQMILLHHDGKVVRLEFEKIETILDETGEDITEATLRPAEAEQQTSETPDQWTGVTVITSNGWEYADVTIEFTEGLEQIIVIRPDGAEKTISRSNVRMILDERGKDITAQVFASAKPTARVKPTIRAPGRTESKAATVEMSEYDQPNNEDLAVKTNRFYRSYEDRFHFALSVGIGYGTSTGDWFEGLTDGVTYNLNARIAVTQTVYIGVNYRVQNLGVESGMFYFYDEYGYPIDVGLDIDVNLHEYFFTVGYMTAARRTTQPVAFGEFGLGAINHVFKMSATYASETYSDEYSESKFALLWSGGGIFPFNKSLGLSLKGTMRMTGTGGEEYGGYEYSGSSGYLLGIDMELIWMI